MIKYQINSQVLVFPHIMNELLISIGQFCDDNCIIIFTKHKFYVKKNGIYFFEGQRNKTDGLWDLKTYKDPAFK